MKLVINKTNILGGRVTPPASKSQTIRALFVATLARGTSLLRNFLFADDTQTAISVCRAFGAQIIFGENNTVRVTGSGIPLNIGVKKIFTADSGITTRFFLPTLGLREDNREPILLDCGEQMKQRPITSLVNGLRDLGLSIKYAGERNRLPVLVSGKLLGGETKVDGITSQYLSALLLTLPLAEQGSSILVENLHERPYLEMTIRFLREQNVEFKQLSDKNFDVFKIKGGQRYSPFQKTIPADFSSASYLIAAAALLPGETVLTGIDISDTQGDKRLIYILQEMGADIQINDSELLISGGKKLTGVKVDANDIPDLVPTLAVIGTQAEGITQITNVEQARLKETDRIHSMAKELKKMGAKIGERKDGLSVKKSALHGCVLHGCGDHRTVMALAVAGLLAEEETQIDTAESINKTFPNFVGLMNDLGCKIKLMN